MVLSSCLVMGAGTVEPLKITKDVTFPDYDLPEVDAVRSAWKSSSFIVINKETIDEIYKGKLDVILCSSGRK